MFDMHQVLLEKYEGPVWTYETLLIIVRDWLSVQGFGKAKVLGSCKQERRLAGKVKTLYRVHLWDKMC